MYASEQGRGCNAERNGETDEHTSCVQRVASLPRESWNSDSIACSSLAEASGRMSGEMKNWANRSRACFWWEL